MASGGARLLGVGDLLPEVVLDGMDGRQLRLRDFAPGRKRIVFMWASW